MNKSVYVALLCSMSFFASSASAATLIDSKGLDNYRKTVDYLNCYYSSATDCGGMYKDVEAAKKALQAYKDMDAVGLNASDKASLDASFSDLMRKISIPELKTYVKTLGELSAEEFFDEIKDGILLEVSMSMPDPISMENSADGNFKGIKYMTDNWVLTKEELMAMNREDEVPYEQIPGSLKDVDLMKETGEGIKYGIINNFLTGTVKTNKSSEASTVGLKVILNSDMEISREGVAPYRMYISDFSMEVKQELDEELYLNSEKTEIDLGVDVDLTDNNYDSGWFDRYEPLKAADRTQRHTDNKKRLLEYAADKGDENIERAYEYYRFARLVADYGIDKQGDIANFHKSMTSMYDSMAKTTSPKKAEERYNKLYEDAGKFLKAGRELYYSNVASINDAEARAIMSRFRESERIYSIFESAREARYKEETRAGRAVVGFSVY